MTAKIDEWNRKRCPHCEQYKPLDAFYDKSDPNFFKDGKSWWCIECIYAYNAEYSVKNAEKIKAQKRVYNAEHSAERSAKEMERYAVNPEKMNEQHRQYYAANAEKLKEDQRQRYAANAELNREKARKYRQENAATISERKKQTALLKKAAKSGESK